MAEQLKITLVDTLKDDWRTLRRLDEIVYTDKGELLLEKYSVGSALSDAFGDSDHERDSRIGPDEVPKVLMALIAERFRSLWAFETWLMQNDIQVTRTAF